MEKATRHLQFCLDIMNFVSPAAAVLGFAMMPQQMALYRVTEIGFWNCLMWAIGSTAVVMAVFKWQDFSWAFSLCVAIREDTPVRSDVLTIRPRMSMLWLAVILVLMANSSERIFSWIFLLATLPLCIVNTFLLAFLAGAYAMMCCVIRNYQGYVKYNSWSIDSKTKQLISEVKLCRAQDAKAQVDAAECTRMLYERRQEFSHRF